MPLFILIWRISVLDEQDRLTLNSIRDMSEYQDYGQNDNNTTAFLTLDNVLDGTARMDLSHAGSELQDLLEENLSKKL